MIKLSVNKTKWAGLLPTCRSCTFTVKPVYNSPVHSGHLVYYGHFARVTVVHRFDFNFFRIWFEYLIWGPKSYRDFRENDNPQNVNSLAPRCGEQGCMVQGTLLPPMWPRFKSWCQHHIWVEFVVDSLLCSDRFFSGYSGFPLSSKTNISKLPIRPGIVGEEPLHRCATFKSLLLLSWVFGTKKKSAILTGLESMTSQTPVKRS